MLARHPLAISPRRPCEQALSLDQESVIRRPTKATNTPSGKESIGATTTRFDPSSSIRSLWSRASMNSAESRSEGKQWRLPAAQAERYSLYRVRRHSAHGRCPAAMPPWLHPERRARCSARRAITWRWRPLNSSTQWIQRLSRQSRRIWPSPSCNSPRLPMSVPRRAWR